MSVCSAVARRVATLPRLALVLIVVLATAAAALVAAGPAAADPATVTGISTSATGALIIELNDDGALLVQVNVLDPIDNSRVLLTTDDLTWIDGGWETSAPVQLPAGAAHGDYPVTVDYRLGDGALKHWAGTTPADEFAYVRHAAITGVAWDRASTDYVHRTATLSGTVAAFDPIDGRTAPVEAGIHVRIQYDAYLGSAFVQQGMTVVTDGSGAFSAAITPGGQIVDGSTSLVDPPADLVETPDGDGQVPLLDVAATKTRIAGGPGKIRVHAGASVTVSGTAQRLTTAGWLPLADAPIITEFTPVSGFSAGTWGRGRTSATGGYKYAVKLSASGTLYTSVDTTDPYLTPNGLDDENVATPVAVPVRSTITALSFTLDQYGTVTARGRLHGPCWSQRLALQYSRNGKSGWAQIGASTTQDVDSRSCSFSVQGYGYTDGYYRLTHTESDLLLAFTTGKYRRYRTPTRESFAISPHQPSRNGRMTATGTLTYKSGAHWKVFNNGRIGLVFRPRGDSTWYLMTTGHTTSKGRYTLHSKAYESGTWGTFYYADAHHFYSQSKTVSIHVR